MSFLQRAVPAYATDPFTAEFAGPPLRARRRYLMEPLILAGALAAAILVVTILVPRIDWGVGSTRTPASPFPLARGACLGRVPRYRLDGAKRTERSSFASDHSSARQQSRTSSAFSFVPRVSPSFNAGRASLRFPRRSPLVVPGCGSAQSSRRRNGIGAYRPPNPSPRRYSVRLTTSSTRDQDSANHHVGIFSEGDAAFPPADDVESTSGCPAPSNSVTQPGPTEPRNPAEHPSVTHAMEDYLKAVYRLQETGAQVTTLRLADELGATGPSVTNMIKRLHDLRLLRHSRYRGVELTDAGQRIALEVLRHHRLLELYLAETLGMPWDAVHAEAERLATPSLRRTRSKDGLRVGIPHARPSRRSNSEPRGAPSIASPERSCWTFSRAISRRSYVFPIASRSSSATSAILDSYPGAQVRLIETLPFEGPIRIEVSGAEHVIGRPLAGAVHVKSNSGT